MQRRGENDYLHLFIATRELPSAFRNTVNTFKLYLYKYLRLDVIMTATEKSVTLLIMIIYY